jgi:ubiquinol-cytochrome c reductase cytochrome c1 subunit
MTMRLAIAAGLALATLAAAPGIAAEGEKPKSESWTFDGVFGRYDRAQLQRGLKVYTTVCASCHGLRQVYYRNLAEIGLTPSEAKAVAAQKEVDVIGDDGQPKKRKADLIDRFVSPFPNMASAASANNGKAPPDLSLIVKAREGGANYIYALLTGYSAPPADWKDEEGKPGLRRR